MAGGWNHRVVRRKLHTETYYQIHEAYYDENGKLDGMTENAIEAFGESVEELRWVLERMLAALDKPVVDYESLKELPMNKE